MKEEISDIVSHLLDKEMIRDCIYRFCRGIDRVDAELIRKSYWPDCIDDHLNFSGNCEEFITWAFPILNAMDQTSHMVSNILINIDGNRAHSESYVYAIHRLNEDGRRSDLVIAGRYLDELEKRNGEWRVLKRQVINDWFRKYEDSADWSNGILGQMQEPGKKCPDDPSYHLQLR